MTTKITTRARVLPGAAGTEPVSSTFLRKINQARCLSRQGRGRDWTTMTTTRTRRYPYRNSVVRRGLGGFETTTDDDVCRCKSRSSRKSKLRLKLRLRCTPEDRGRGDWENSGVGMGVGVSTLDEREEKSRKEHQHHQQQEQEQEQKEEEPWYPDDWDEWMAYLKEAKAAERRGKELRNRLEAACVREAYDEASQLKEELERIRPSCAVREAREHLRDLVQRNCFEEASRVRDEAGTRYSGWWVGRCKYKEEGEEGEEEEEEEDRKGLMDPNNDPYGHVILVEPSGHSSLVATGYCGQELVNTFHSSKDTYKEKVQRNKAIQDRRRRRRSRRRRSSGSDGGTSSSSSSSSRGDRGDEEDENEELGWEIEQERKKKNGGEGGGATMGQRFPSKDKDKDEGNRPTMGPGELLWELIIKKEENEKNTHQNKNKEQEQEQEQEQEMSMSMSTYYKQMMVTYSLLADEESLDILSGEEISEDLEQILHKFSLEDEILSQDQEKGPSPSGLASGSAENNHEKKKKKKSKASEEKEKEEEEEKDIFRRADEDDEEITDLQELRRIDSELSEVFSRQHSVPAEISASAFDQVELLESELDSLEEVPRPAQLIAGKDLDRFDIVWKYPRIEFSPKSSNENARGEDGQEGGEEEEKREGEGEGEGLSIDGSTLYEDVKELQQSKSGAYSDLLSALKELVKDASSKLESAKEKDVPLSTIYNDSVSATNTLHLLEELDTQQAPSHEDLVVSYERIHMRHMQHHHDLDPFTGIYYASYGAHGVELLQMERRTLADEEGYLHEYAVGTKLTGDPHVPAGQVTFKAKVSPRHKLSRSSTSGMKYPELLGVQSLYKGQGRTAGKGFTHPRWVDGELLVLGSNSVIGEGAPLAFVFSMSESLFDDFGEEERRETQSGVGGMNEEEEEGEETDENDHMVMGDDEGDDEDDDMGLGLGLDSSPSPHKVKKVVMLLHRLDLTRLKGKEKQQQEPELLVE